jgi:2-oxoglutarate dehydrogenase E2 component (dihydrolipoamide succinyltransferase)
VGSGQPGGDSGGGADESASDAGPREAPAADRTPQAPQEAQEQGTAPAEQRTVQGSDSSPSEPEPRPNQPRTGDDPAQPPAATTRTSPADQPGGSTGSQDGGGRAGDGAYVTPLVRKLAAQHGVDLASLEGTGVGGRIRKQDVLDAAKAAQEAPAAEQPAPAAAGVSAGQPAGSAGPQGRPAPPAQQPSPLRGRTEPLSRLRKVIAKRMVESLQTSAQLTTVIEVDVTEIGRLRNAVKNDFVAREGVKLSYMPFFVKAAIDALKVHPALNAAIDTEKGEVTYFDHENVAIAVDTEKGLLTPVIKNAGDLNVAGIARKIADLAERTRTNKIGPDELAGGTFTLTNTGSRGALFDTPILNQPQVAILGTGAVVKRPVVIDDPRLGEAIAVRQMVYLALTYDHRLVDGADAARFLADVKQRLEAGAFEV